MRGQALIFAGALALASFGAAVPAGAEPYYSSAAPVDPYCAQQKNNKGLMGAGLGAAAGAVLGGSVASKGRKTEGAVLGGVLGAVGGAMAGRAMTRCAGAYDPYSQNSGQSNSGYDQYGLAGAPPAQPTSYSGARRNSAPCRWGEITTRDPDGFTRTESVQMCRGADGTWRPR